MRFSPEKRFSLAVRGALLAAFVLMVSHPALTFSQAAKALIVWYRSIVPTLLPVLIVSSLIVATRAWELLIPILHPILGRLFCIPPCGSFSLLLGMLCGYPMGTKIVSDLYREGELSPKEARHLLTFTSFPSPMFLNGFLLHQCFDNSSLVIPFLGAVYGSAFVIGILYPRIIPLFSFFSGKDASGKPFSGSSDHSASTVLTKSSSRKTSSGKQPVLTFAALQQTLLSSAQILLLVGLYMMLAMILSGFLELFLSRLSAESVPHVLPLLTGLLEMTTGISFLPASGLSLSSAALVAIFLCCFGGLSIALQTSAVLPKGNFWFLHYLFWKLIHGVIAVCFLKLIFLIFPVI